MEDTKKPTLREILEEEAETALSAALSACGESTDFRQQLEVSSREAFFPSTGTIEARFFDEPTGECRKSAESAGKARLDLVPTAAVEQVAAVLTFGAGKYGDNNWRRGARWGRYYAAALRHVFAWWRGEDLDPETGLSHLAHAVCCLLFLMEYQGNGWGTDDRFKGPDGEEFKKADGQEPRIVQSSHAEGNIGRERAARVIAKFKDDRELRRYIGL